jgi:hypothetical protein
MLTGFYVFTFSIVSFDMYDVIEFLVSSSLFLINSTITSTSDG